MNHQWLIAGIALSALSAWAWRAMNPRPAMIFIAAVFLILAASASTFGMGLSHWSYRQNQRSRP